MFFLVFVVPLAIFLIWLMRQEKHKKMAITGMIVVVVLVIGAIAYTYWQAGRQH
jgi:nitrate reductase gamma subunit